MIGKSTIRSLFLLQKQKYYHFRAKKAQKSPVSTFPWSILTTIKPFFHNFRSYRLRVRLQLLENINFNSLGRLSSVSNDFQCPQSYLRVQFRSKKNDISNRQTTQLCNCGLNFQVKSVQSESSRVPRPGQYKTDGDTLKILSYSRK